MNEYQILEGNLKIKKYHLQQVHQQHLLDSGAIMYNRSWDWLYPVLQLIEKQGYTVNMGPTSCQIKDGEELITTRNLQDGRLAGTWQAVIDFIDFYKTQTQ
jgi:hypothetical protein